MSELTQIKGNKTVEVPQHVIDELRKLVFETEEEIPIEEETGISFLENIISILKVPKEWIVFRSNKEQNVVKKVYVKLQIINNEQKNIISDLPCVKKVTIGIDPSCRYYFLLKIELNYDLVLR